MRSEFPVQYNLVREGQKLYYFDEDTGEIVCGSVEQKNESFFTFAYLNKIDILPYDIIGDRLFLHRLGLKKVQEQFWQEKQAAIAEERRQAAIEAEIEAKKREAERIFKEKQAAEEKEKEIIYKYLEQREVNFLVHFTPISNLPSILKYGILPRSELNARRIHADTPDKDRLDNRLDYSSFSIAFPNYKVFFNKRCTTQYQYAVLIIDPQIILDLPLSAISYLPGNAASNKINNAENYIGIDAVKALYSPTVQIGETIYTREQMGIPDHYPTNPQAEVFIRSAIKPQYIRSIKGETSAQVAEIKELLLHEAAQSPLLLKNKINYNKDFFMPRVDHRFWKEEAKTSVEES